MKSGIYKILNLINSKFYIGSAANILVRWQQHRNNLKYNKHKNQHLQAAWNLYNKINFKFIIIEECSIINLIEREQYWLDLTKCYDREVGYNINIKANSMLGFKHSNETKFKFKNRIYTDQQKANMSAGQKGKKYSEETKLKLSKVRKGRIVSEKVKAQVSLVHKGKIISEETRALISAANIGRKISPEAIAKREASRLRNKQERLQNGY